MESNAIRKRKEYQSKTKITFKGIEYGSITSCCRAFNINTASLYLYRQRHDTTITEALEALVKLNESRKVIINEVEYRNAKEACDELNISYSSMQHYSKRNNLTFEESIYAYLYNKVNTHNIEITIDNNKFYSIREMCRHYGIDSRKESFNSKNIQNLTDTELKELIISNTTNVYMNIFGELVINKYMQIDKKQ